MLVSPLRILPLLASATEIVHALGLGEYQVGRSHECDFPPLVLSLPVCTAPVIDVTGPSAEIDSLVKQQLSNALSIYRVDAELIASLQPTHIITQTQCKVCAVSLEDVETALQTQTGTQAKVISLAPFALCDLWNDIRRVASALGESDRADHLITALQGRLHGISTKARSATSRPTVTALEWLDPLMAAGNWVPELIELAAGENLFGSAGQHSPWMQWDQLRAANPDVILAMPCGFDLARTKSEMRCITKRPEWRDLSAVQRGQIYLCDGNQFFNRSGPRLIDSLQILAEILHPDLFPPKLQGTGWAGFHSEL